MLILLSATIYLFVVGKNNKFTRTKLSLYSHYKIFVFISLIMCIALLFTNSEISKADIENIKSYCSFIDSIYFDGIILFGYIIIQTFLIILKKKSFIEK